MVTGIIIVPDILGNTVFHAAHGWLTATPSPATVPTLPRTLAALKPPTTGIIIVPDVSI